MSLNIHSFIHQAGRKTENHCVCWDGGGGVGGGGRYKLWQNAKVLNSSMVPPENHGWEGVGGGGGAGEKV